MIKIGATISIAGRTDGNGRFQKYHKPANDTVSVIYSDGRVGTASGDVFSVRKVRGHWLAR
jgi:hypothetical protein